MQRSEPKVIYQKINGGEGDSVSQHQKVIQQRSTKSKLLGVCSSESHPCLKSAQVAKWSGILGGQCGLRTPGAQKEQGFLSVAQIPGFGSGKPAAISETRSGLSTVLP